MLRRSSFVKSHACALAIIVMLAMGCRREALAPLRVAAASDLQSALPRLNERFQARTGIVASLTFGASGQLSQQIKQGAPFDVFLSADEAIIHALAVGGFVKSGSIHRYTRGSLVLAVNEAFAEQVQSLDDLTKPVVKKIALANPAIAPYGRAGEQALQRAALWDRIEPKIVIAESVRQALLYAQKGDVEAALVGRAIANVPEVRRVAIESELYDPIIQALGVVTATARSAEAEKFAGFITGAEGQGILKEFGFSGIEP
jgi:molybdate transport system substrate-binding protein